MVKGIISWDSDGEQAEMCIDECDIVFVFGIKQTGETNNGRDYCSPSMVKGVNIIPAHIMQCLATSVIAQIERMYTDDPEAAYVAMQLFKEHVEKQADKFMLENLVDILAGKVREDHGK